MISVITPVFNGEKYIADCIQTVIAQNLNDIEHIILDGKSTDKTVEIIREYAGKYPHIRWVSEKDNGQSDAMNKGIAMARGEVIGFLNVDDFYNIGVLNTVQRIISDLPEPSLVVGNCNVWDSKGNLLYVNKPKKLQLTDLLLGFSINPHPVNPSAYFYHKSLHERIGMYDENEHYALDLDFILKAVQVANVVYIDETWGNYRFIEGTKTYEDQKYGQNTSRVGNLFNKYLKALPVNVRIMIHLKRLYFSMTNRVKLPKIG